MIDFIARYFSSLWELLTAPLRLIWRGIAKIFPPRDCTVTDTSDGQIRTYQQSSFWRFARFCMVVTMSLWAAWSTYVFVYHRPLLQKRTQQLEQLRAQHNRHMNDLKVYLQKYTDLTKTLNLTDDKILNATKDGAKKLSDKEKEDLINTKSKIIGELDFLKTRISEMMEDENYTPEFDKVSELSMEFELVRNENNTLKQQTVTVTDSVADIAAADKIMFTTSPVSACPTATRASS